LRLVGRNRKDDLAPDVGVIAFRQAHGAKEQAHRDLTGKIVDELERFRLADARQRAVGNFDCRSNEELDVLAGESGLAQRPQPVVTGRVGRSQRCASTTGKLIDHIALRGREGFPLARRPHDVVIA
jgi:hypothetical protein